MAALAAVAALGGKAFKDAADANAQNRARALHKQQQQIGILQNRAQMGGADTLRSTLASNDQEFLRNLAANRRDTSGDMLPFVNALSGVAQGIASDVAKTPSAPKAQQSLAPISNTLDQFDDPNDPAKRSFLMGIAKRNGWQ